jgi:hypothetical protein
MERVRGRGVDSDERAAAVGHFGTITEVMYSGLFLEAVVP